MKRIAVVAAVAAMVLAGCKKPKGPQTTDIAAPGKSADELTPAGGEVAEVPEERPVKTTPKPDETAKPAAKERTHVVQPKDTLWSLAVKFYGDGKQWKKIAAANGITDEKKLPVGKVLKIPK